MTRSRISLNRNPKTNLGEVSRRQRSLALRALPVQARLGREPGSLVRTKFLALISLICDAVYCINMTGCEQSGLTNNSVELSDQRLAVNVIGINRIERSLLTATYFGSLQPSNQRSIGFGSVGRIQTVVKNQTRVAQGEVLAELDMPGLREQREALQNELDQAQSEFRDQQIQQLQRSIAEVDQQLEAGTIVAPFDCIVDEIFIFQGSLARQGSPVLRVIELAQPKIKINLPRRVDRWLNQQQEVVFLLDEQRLLGKFSEKSATENPTGSITVWFDVVTDISSIEFSFGRTVEAKFDFEQEVAGFWLPLSALSRSAEGVWSVLTIVNDSADNSSTTRVARKLVGVKQLLDEFALVDGNLASGELVVANGLHRVVPGQPVTVNQLPFDGPNPLNSGAPR